MPIIKHCRNRNFEWKWLIKLAAIFKILKNCFSVNSNELLFYPSFLTWMQEIHKKDFFNRMKHQSSRNSLFVLIYTYYQFWDSLFFDNSQIRIDECRTRLQHWLDLLTLEMHCFLCWSIFILLELQILLFDEFAKHLNVFKSRSIANS